MRNYTPLQEVETPFHTAKQTWDNRLGKAWREGHYWMWAFFIMLAYTLWTGYANKRLEAARLAKPIEIFYVAMGADGIGQVLGKAPLVTTPDENAKQSRVRRFIVHTRSKSLDPVVVRRYWDEAHQWVTPRGATLLNEFATERKPLLHNPRLSIEVDITRLILKSDQSYDVWWTETRRDHNHHKTEALAYWSGNYTIKVDKPKDEQQLRANETGVFVDYFTATRAW
jgi:type IV secretion system protein TrbF